MPSLNVAHADLFYRLPRTDPAFVAAVVCDPPYGIALSSHNKTDPKHIRFGGQTDIIEGDKDLAVAKFVYRWCRANNVPLVMFYSPFLPRPGKFRSVLVWAKGGHVGGGGDMTRCWKRDFELVGVAFNGPLNGKRDSSVVRINSNVKVKPTGHAAEKPVELMRYLIRKVVPPGKLVLDPCMGSGSTGVAAAQLGCGFEGWDVDAKWVKVARDRVGRAKVLPSLNLRG